MPTSGSKAFLDLLAGSGVKYVFGNPGTTELPLVDALADDERFEYILGLQEVPVMAAADGFALASRELGVVNLHISCGLGNAMGMLYNAFREGSPLLVTAGQQDRRLKFADPVLASDLARVAEPWTKWSVEVERIEDLPAAVRRAVQTALTPPTGPVFMALPVDLMMEEAELDLTPPRPVDARLRPPQDALRRGAELLARAARPAILCGSRVVEAGAVNEVVALAEQLGAPVFSESGTTHGRLSFPSTHSLYAGCLPLWSPEIRDKLAPFDVLLIVGLDLKLYIYFEPSQPLPEQLQLVQFDQDPAQVGKNYPVEVGLVGDYQAGLAELHLLLEDSMSDAAREQARARMEAHGEKRRQRQDDLASRAAEQIGQRPLTPLVLMSTLAKILPPRAAIVEEAVTTTLTYFERLGVIDDPSGYFGHRGWALGWGLGCALGVKLAWPERPVLALLGDGAAMYGIQGLWTAARYQIPVTFVICNNAQYQILKVGAQGMQLPQAVDGRFEGMDLTGPEIDFVSLARSLGVEAARIGNPAELAERVRESLFDDKPHLFDVPISRALPSQLEY